MIFERHKQFYARLLTPKHPSTQTLHAQAPQHAAEIAMAELHAAILNRAAVRSG